MYGHLSPAHLAGVPLTAGGWAAPGFPLPPASLYSRLPYGNIYQIYLLYLDIISIPIYRRPLHQRRVRLHALLHVRAQHCGIEGSQGHGHTIVRYDINIG